MTGLKAAYDDPDDPEQLTLYPAGVGRATRWVTIDVGHAVRLDRVR